MNSGTSAIKLDAAYAPAYAPPAPARPARPRPAARPAPKTVAQPRVREQAEPVARPYMKIRPRTVIFALMVMAGLMLIVYHYMQLSLLTRENQVLEKELAKLEQQEILLRREYESVISIQEIEAYATDVLGMVKPSQDQIFYVDLAGEDHAVVLEDKSMWDTVSDFIADIGERLADFFG